MNRYGRGRIRLWRKHRHTASLKSFAPGVFIFGMVTIFLCGAVEFVYKINFDSHLPLLGFSIYGAVFTLYVWALFAESARLAFKQKRLNLWWHLFGSLYNIHLHYGWGVLREFFFPKR
jgi:hypothetical protein